MEEDEDLEDQEEEVEVINEQFGDYTCPHCGKRIQVIVTAPVDDEDEDEDLI